MCFHSLYSSHVEREETMAKQVSLRKIGTAEVKSRISQAKVPGRDSEPCEFEMGWDDDA